METDQFKSEFLSLTSRELRQVLHIVKGYCEILNSKNEKLTSKERDRCFQLLDKNILRLERFVGSIDELDNITQGNLNLVLDSVNISDLLETIFEPYRIRFEKRFEYKLIHNGKKNSIVVVDSERIAQAIDNIIQNSIDHTSITRRHISVLCNLTLTDIIKISISDNGAGISIQDLKKVSDPFVSIPTKYSIGGTGIGLFISNIIIRNHGGTMSINSAGINKGTTVEFTIPRFS